MLAPFCSDGCTIIDRNCYDSETTDGLECAISNYLLTNIYEFLCYVVTEQTVPSRWQKDRFPRLWYLRAKNQKRKKGPKPQDGGRDPNQGVCRSGI